MLVIDEEPTPPAFKTLEPPYDMSRGVVAVATLGAAPLSESGGSTDCDDMLASTAGDGGSVEGADAPKRIRPAILLSGGIVLCLLAERWEGAGTQLCGVAIGGFRH